MDLTDLPERLQRLRRHRVRNLLPFGMRLQEAVSEVYDRGIWFSEFDGGFQDGGCLIFASALSLWSKGQIGLKAIYCRTIQGIPQHVVGCLGPLLFDSDGVGTDLDLIRKIRKYSGLQAPYVGPYELIDTDDCDKPIPYRQALVDYMSAEFTSILGSFNYAAIVSGLMPVSPFPSLSSFPKPQ